MNSTYDEKLIFKKHLIIKNPILSKLLIAQSKVNSTAKNIKANRNKLTLVGLIFYILIIILLMFICYMLFVVPPIKSSPFIIDTKRVPFYIYTKTLNQKISVILSMILFLSETAVFVFNTYKTFTKEYKSKAKIKNKE